MNRLVELELGIEAIMYIRECLADGNTLAKNLLASLDLSAGNVTTSLPKDANIEQAKTNFNWAVLPEAPESELVHYTMEDGRKATMKPKYEEDSQTVQAIQEYLQGELENLCVFENSIAEACDPQIYIRNKASKLWTFENEVYHILVGGKISEVRIRKAIKEASNAWPLFIGALTSFPGQRNDYSQKKVLNTNDLEVLAKRTQKLIIGAYDGEGYLIWNRPN